jgi:hypothetical protein
MSKHVQSVWIISSIRCIRLKMLENHLWHRHMFNINIRIANCLRSALFVAIPSSQFHKYYITSISNIVTLLYDESARHSNKDEIKYYCLPFPWEVHSSVQLWRSDRIQNSKENFSVCHLCLQLFRVDTITLKYNDLIFDILFESESNEMSWLLYWSTRTYFGHTFRICNAQNTLSSWRTHSLIGVWCHRQWMQNHKGRVISL